MIKKTIHAKLHNQRESCPACGRIYSRNNLAVHFYLLNNVHAYVLCEDCFDPVARNERFEIVWGKSRQGRGCYAS